MLKVLHVPFTFAPDPVGGTEIYVEDLAQSLRAYGVESLIAAPSSKGLDEAYEHNGLHVRRYRFARRSKHMLRELYGDGDPEACAAFARILDEERPNVVHLHALTREISPLLARAAKQRGLLVFFTYHTPAVSCQRGTLMIWGKRACDGKLIARRCTNCSLQGRGVPRWASAAFSYVPPGLARLVQKTNLSWGGWTALQMNHLLQTRCDAFRAFMREVDGVVAPRMWLRTLLMENGVSASKIVLSLHGLSNVEGAQGPAIDLDRMPLRVACIGRTHRVKGVDTLIKAVRTAPELKIELDIYLVSQGASDEEYRNELESLAAHDARIEFLAPVPHETIVSTLRGYHLLAAPSRWLETGPLVVLESFLAGTPVVGSDLGGIAELVRHERNGLLVRFDDVLAWAEALERCARDRQLLARLRKGVQRPRSMMDVAREMAQLYQIASKDRNLLATSRYTASAGSLQTES